MEGRAFNCVWMSAASVGEAALSGFVVEVVEPLKLSVKVPVALGEGQRACTAAAPVPLSVRCSLATVMPP